MKWWKFLLLSYLAMSFDMVMASAWTWQHASAEGLLLLGAMLIMGSDQRRLFPQLCLLGLLRDFVVGTPLGLSAAVFVLMAWGVSLLPLSRSSRERIWWLLPLLCLGLGFILTAQSLLMESAWPSISVISDTVHRALLTFAMGIVVVSLRRLVTHRTRQTRHELEPSAFFLSR